MTTISESYPDIVKKIEKKEISKKEIDEFFINFIKKQINDIKEGKRDDMDIGDVFPIWVIATNKGYKFNKNLEEFIIKLGDYKLEMNGQYVSELSSIEEVEKEFKNFLHHLRED